MAEKTTSKKSFHYVIARYWDEVKKGHLCIYAYGKDVFYGDDTDAIEMMDFINNRCESENKGKYQIFKIDHVPMNTNK